jgi:hypothetical protein
MLFDTALTLLQGQRTRGAVKAIAEENWSALAQLVEEGLNPNQILSTKSLPDILRQRANQTTPLLAMSMQRLGGDDAQAQIKRDTYSLLLAKGGDPFLAVGNDKRNSFVHLANIRNLEGVRLIAAAGIDVRKANIEDNQTDWEAGIQWAREYRAQMDALEIQAQTPQNDGVRSMPRF